MASVTFAKGMVLRKREVPCTRGCGRTVMRSNHYRDARCDACAKKHTNEIVKTYRVRIREQARRYRILLAIGPYKTYEELYRALRVRNPMDPNFRFDMAIERRSA